MISREELLKSEEYWFETIQNDIFRMVNEYLEQKGINQSELANKLGVTKGYISQIMNGNFNYTLKKLIELSVKLDKAPVLELKDLNLTIAEDSKKRFETKYQQIYQSILQGSITTTTIQSGMIVHTKPKQSKAPVYECPAAA